MKSTPLPKLTESIIRAAATPESFQRGRQYYESGAISNASIQEDMLLADCEGTSAPYYQVRIELDKAGIRHAECTCPYDWGGLCKHMVALLLTYLHDRRQFSLRAPPAELLADLSRDDLMGLLSKLMREQPGLYDRVAADVTLPKKAKPGQAKRREAIDLDVYRRRVIGILHSLDGMRASEAYWQVGGLVQQLAEVQEAAMKFLDAGEPQAALDILLILAEEASRGFEFIDDSNGELGGFLGGIGLPLAETILSLELSPSERKKLTARLDKLERWLADYGSDDNLYLARQAAEQGWDSSPAEGAGRRPARRDFTGRGWSLATASHRPDEDDEEADEDEFYDDDDEDGDVGDEAEWYESGYGDLTDAKLNILGRRGDTEAYLNLCLETGRHLRYAIKLAEIDRVPEAVKHARQKLGTAGEAHQLAEALRTGGHVPEALAVAEHGLKLQAPRYALAAWLAPVEEAQGRTAAALAAWQAAFAEDPSLAIYQALKRLAGAKWKKLEKEEISSLRRSGDNLTLAQILIEEQDWDEAIKVAERRQSWYNVAETVADAVLAHRPEWVAQISRKHAERLMVEPQSKNYPIAGAWLKRAKQAHAALDQTTEWRAYVDKLKDKYRRRPALQEQLRRL